MPTGSSGRPVLTYAVPVPDIGGLISEFARVAWGPWLLALLLGGGVYFLGYSRGLPFRHLGHAVGVLLGRYDNPSDEGQISHFQALSSALAGTIGMGNIAGVAVAVQRGGPGSVFWMGVSAIVGVATKFFTCSLAIQFRGRDSLGRLQGGPMYAIVEGLGQRWKPMAMFFALCALFGTLPMFQANQITQILRDLVAVPSGWLSGPEDARVFNLAVGLVVASFAVWSLLGGIPRIGRMAARLVPAMVVLYLGTGLIILALNFQEIPAVVALILHDAFTGEAVAGGAVATVIVTGVRRAAYSNEAGIGSEALAHGAAKTNEATREGLVAMLGPMVDTVMVCSMTSLVILSSGSWQDTASGGVTVTSAAFEQSLPGVGNMILLVCVLFFAVTTIPTCGYYGEKSLGYLMGAERQNLYKFLYVASITVGALTSLDAVIDFTDGMFAMMAIPTMTSSLLLSPHVMRRARRYFSRMETRPA